MCNKLTQPVEYHNNILHIRLRGFVAIAFIALLWGGGMAVPLTMPGLCLYKWMEMFDEAFIEYGLSKSASMVWAWVWWLEGVGVIYLEDECGRDLKKSFCRTSFWIEIKLILGCMWH